MSLEFVINGEASAGAGRKLLPFNSTPPTGATSRRRPPRGAFPIPRPLAVVDYLPRKLYQGKELLMLQADAQAVRPLRVPEVADLKTLIRVSSVPLGVP